MAATVRNSKVNGDTYDTTAGLSATSRFADIPAAIDIPVGGIEGEEVEVNLEDQLDDPTELCQLLENEKAAKNLWITIALAYAKQTQIDHAVEILQRGLGSLAKSGPKDRLSLLGCIAWMDLLKSRQAPRVAGEGQLSHDIKTKEHFLREATASMNEATRINPAYPPLYLTRGVLNLLRASLATSTKTGSIADAERTESLNQALKCFDEAYKISDGRNMMALIGRARAQYSLKRYTQSMATYQQVLSRMPNMTEPDPRIGIGCCLWQLGYLDNARAAWTRALALQPTSKTAHALLGVYYLRESGKYAADDPKFTALYKKAMTEHIRQAYTIDKEFPLSCAVFASYFLLTGRYEVMDPLARKAIEQTDINAIASDGWYLLARKEHMNNDLRRANDAYSKADQARGGQNAGYLPAKFGLVQILIQSGDVEDAKFRLEKLLEKHKAVEVMTLLGCIYAEEVFAVQKIGTKDDKTADIRKAIRMLENVRRTWKDEKAKLTTKPDESVLLYLARLYESENPLESMKCLQQVEKLQLDKIPDEDKPDPNLEASLFAAQIREHLPPQLLNNMGCFYYGNEQWQAALETFQIALNACVKLNERQAEEKRAAEEGNVSVDDIDSSDTDALVTTISYNLGRVYEALGQKEDAIKVYEGTLVRHHDYTEASARLAYIALQDSPLDQGPRKVAAVYQSDYGNTEVRALMGWYYHSSKKKTANLAEDQENRHYKHTLQGYDKHDLYSLTGMGNVHLAIARDMPRTTDAEKDKRTKMYQKAYEFFDKALQLDPKNAYAAQGIAIALCDDKKNYSDALQILTKIKDTIRDISVYTNLGHVYCELRQYQRSIDNYEIALRKQTVAQVRKVTNADEQRKDGKENAQLLACLSRAWLLKGKNDKSILSLNTSLDYMKRSLATQPDSPHLQFNVAFIQFQIVQIVNSQTEMGRTLEDVNAARQGLEEAIATFESVAKSKNPPYPRSALEQRAAMSKGTMRKQLERSYQQQSEYERSNATKLKEARERREEDFRRREDAKQVQRAEEEARVAKIAEERQKIIEETEKMAEQLRAEALAREAAEYTEDEEMGERVKRATKKKVRTGGGGGGGGRSKRKDRDDDGFIEDDEVSGASERSVSRTPISGSEDEAGPDREAREKQPKKKRRKLERKGGNAPKDKPGKYKSAAVIVDSDSDEEPEAVATPRARGGSDEDDDVPMGGRDAKEDDDDDDEEPVGKPTPAPRKRKQLRTIADDDDEDEDEDDGGGNAAANTLQDDDE